jgi:hypothetical protein
MAFEIGQRVTSSFTGPGTVKGGLFRDEYREVFQKVDFDNPSLGLRDWLVNKLEPLFEEPKKIVVTQTPAEQDYAAATAEGLTHFQTVEYDKDDADVDARNPYFQALAVSLASRGCRITVYATPKNVAKVAKELADILSIDLDKAIDLVSLRDRKTSGGSKWNVDFANWAGLTVETRDALRVNFGHTYSKKVPDIRRIRIGSTKLVQALIKAGFPVTRVYEADGETRKSAERGRDVK